MAQSDFADWNIRLFSVDESSNPDEGSHFACSNLVPTVPIIKFLLKSKTPSSEIQWKRGWKRWCGSSAPYLASSSWNYKCTEIKCMQIQKINRTKATIQSSCIHSSIKQEQILIKREIFFLSPSLESAFSSRVNKTSGFRLLHICFENLHAVRSHHR